MWRPFLPGPLLASIPREFSAAEALYSGRLVRRWNSNIKMTKQLKRMFDRHTGSKKKKIFPGPVNLAINSSEDADFKPRRKPVYTEGQKRRAHQVGKVLYDNIVHLINSGAVCDQLATLSVEIVRVKVVPDFSSVNVYWLTSGTKEDDDTVQTLLTKNAGHLRQLLTSLYLLGTIPRISFVRDDSQARYLKVESLLLSADFGPDFVPTRLDSAIRTITLSAQDPHSSPPAPEEQVLQEQFDALNISAVGEEMGQTGETLTAQEKDVHSMGGLEGERVNGSSVDSGKSKVVDKSDKVDPFRVWSEDSERPPPPCQPSSMDVEQLSGQYLSSLHQSSDKAHNPDSAALWDTDLGEDTGLSTALSKVFRDDMYKVPHSELLKKVLMKKQRAGRRPTVRVDTNESETVMLKKPSTSLKSLLQKKTKGRVKPQSDYHGTDFVEMNRDHHIEDSYADDLEESIEEEEIIEEDHFSTSDDLSSKK
ncbi:hypothetical protein ACOMHN_004500 [Nucella lapillus]